MRKTIIAVVLLLGATTANAQDFDTQFMLDDQAGQIEDMQEQLDQLNQNLTYCQTHYCPMCGDRLCER